jgi:hypothetical protein
MSRSLALVILVPTLFATSSCCCTERGPHTVRKAWADYNTLQAPAFYLEQEDHLPYPATQVAYYRWMYDKDPGHQLACLGVIPPRTCPNCDPIPPGNDPFEYEVVFPAGIPRQNDELWGNKLPEPINVPGGATHSDALPGGGASQGITPPSNTPAPILPPPPRAVEELKTSGQPTDRGAADAPAEPRPQKNPARLPTFDLPTPVPKPIDEHPAPLIGPAAQQGPNLRLTTDQPVSSDADSSPSPDAVWPR